MRTEAEINAKLRYLKQRMKVKPNFWNILVLQNFEELLMWWKGGKFTHKEVGKVVRRGRKSSTRNLSRNR